MHFPRRAKQINDNGAHQIYLRAPGEKRRPPPEVRAVMHLDEPGLKGFPLHHNLDRMLTTPLAPAPAAVGFLLMALGVWAADKLLARNQAPDAWTREIALHLPAPAGARLAPQWAQVLNFLTGDLWTLKPREVPLDLGFAGRWEHSWRPQAVALFSGGLDSLAGAIDQLEAGQRLLLVSHHDYGQLASSQQNLAGALAAHYGPDRVQHLNFRVQFPEAPELTLRSRSLLYLALGVTAATALGPETPVLIPENGWVSLNPPLTLNRLGTYTTRTTHPHFLHQVTRRWRQAGLKNPLVNPYRRLSKGEVLSQCRHPELLGRLASRSTSCARPVASRWRRRPAGECGYCYPCLLRRAALHRLGGDRAEDYRLNPLADTATLRHRIRGRDLRALLLALRTWEEAPDEVAARVPGGEFPPGGSLRDTGTATLLASGFADLRRLLEDRGPAVLRAYLGEG